MNLEDIMPGIAGQTLCDFTYMSYPEMPVYKIDWKLPDVGG